MHRYFLHVKDGSDILEDHEGQDFADVSAALSEAVAAARDLMAEDLRCGRPLGLRREIIIADENGVEVLTVSFGSALPQELG